MRILFLTQVLPFPLVSGAKVRAYHMLQYLAQAHEVTLVSFVREDDRPEDIAYLKEVCQAVHPVLLQRSRLKDIQAVLKSIFTRQPIVIARDNLPAFEHTLTELINKQDFDVVHADQTAMAQYALFAQACHPFDKRPKIILDQHNALYLLVKRQAEHERFIWLRWLWQREARLLRLYETGLCRQFDHILTVTEEDRQALLKLVPNDPHHDKFSVLPICIDPTTQPLLKHIHQGNRLIHLGTMFWPPNVEGVLWFTEQVLPFIVQEVPDVIFVIAGKNPPPRIIKLTHPNTPLAKHIEVTGFVPNPADILANSRVFIVPVQAGGGMRVKILDAWLWGLPIVSTTIGAEGIYLQEQENILIADTPQEFARAVIQLLQDESFNDALRKNGREWVEKHYDWHHIYPQFGNILEHL